MIRSNDRRTGAGSAESSLARVSSKLERPEGGNFVIARFAISCAVLAIVVPLATGSARAQAGPSQGSVSGAPAPAQGALSGSVPGKLVPGVLQISLQDAIQRGLKADIDNVARMVGG